MSEREYEPKRIPPTHELSFTVTWQPVLDRKTTEQEFGAVIAHVMELLMDDNVVITNKTFHKFNRR